MLSSETINFLRKIWSYQSEDARVACVCFRDTNKKKFYFKHFIIKELGGHDRIDAALKEIDDILSKIKDIDKKDVLFQVLLLDEEPLEGRGSEDNVRVGKVVWLDLDYKTEVTEETQETGLKELDDYALDGIIEIDGKKYRITRPPLSKVLNQIKEKLNIEPTFIVDSGGGYHIYFVLDKELEAKRIKDILKRLVKTFPNSDRQATDLCRLLRLPDSINPKYGRKVKIIYYREGEIPTEELYASLATLEKRQTQEVMLEGEKKIEGFREIDESKILKIVDLIKPIYKPGYRQMLCLYLSGWLAKAKISPISAAKIIKLLHDTTEDEDDLALRISTIVYSYKKQGYTDEKIYQKLEEQFGKIYGKEYNVHLEEVKGKSGIYEIAKDILKSEDQANILIKELSETLETLSPEEEPVWIPLVIGKTGVTYAVANPSSKQILRITIKGGEIYRKEIIAYVYPKEIVIYSNEKMQITFSSKTSGDFIIGPDNITNIAKKVGDLAVVANSRLWKDILSSIVEAYKRHNRVIIREEPPERGFYLKTSYGEDEIVAVKYEVPKEISKERLREALMLLNELAEIWFAHVKDKFSFVIKWGIFAPFGFILKKKHGPSKFLKWLYLYGNSKTGKTTLGRLILKMWGLGSEYNKGGTAIDTVPRLGLVISKSTFPFLINEPGDIFSNQGIVDMMKSAIENVIARAIVSGGAQQEIPSLAPLIITSNSRFPEDDSLQRRFYILTFSYSKRISEEKQKEFQKKIEPRLEILSRIGEFVTYYVIRNQKEFFEDIAQKEPLEVSTKILKEAYRFCDLEIPEWVDLNIELEEEDPRYIVIERFLVGFRKIVDEAFVQNFGKIYYKLVEGQLTIEEGEKKAGDVSFKQKLKILLEKGILASYGVLYFAKRQVIGFTKTFLNKIDLRDLSLESFGEIVFGIKNVKETSFEGKSIKCIQVLPEDLYALFDKYEFSD